MREKNMNQIEQIMQLDCDYIKSFSHSEIRKEGMYFYNKEMSTYYDANHAHIWREIKDPQSFLLDIKKFYEAKSLVPRLYLYGIEENQHCVEALQEHGFQYETFIDEIQCWNGEFVQLSPAPEIQIERVTDANLSEALAIEMSITTFGEPALIKEAFLRTYHSPHFKYYLLRVGGVACCTANVFTTKKQGRIESVATLESYRGRGLISYLLQHIQKESVKEALEHLWILPISEQVAKVYAKSNFETVGKVSSIHAFTEGKSIQEIRQEN